MRARMSVTLPAPNGTTIVTRWVGQLCADAGAAANSQRPPWPPRRTISFTKSFHRVSSWESVIISLGAATPGSCTRFGLPHHFVETSTKILQHHGSGISPRTAGNRAARVRGRTGLVEARDRHAVLRPAGRRPQAPPPAPRSARRRGRSRASCAGSGARDRAGFRPRAPGSCRRSDWARSAAASSDWPRRPGP